MVIICYISRITLKNHCLGSVYKFSKLKPFWNAAIAPQVKYLLCVMPSFNQRKAAMFRSFTSAWCIFSVFFQCLCAWMTCQFFFKLRIFVASPQIFSLFVSSKCLSVNFAKYMKQYLIFARKVHNMNNISSLQLAGITGRRNLPQGPSWFNEVIGKDNQKKLLQ